MNNNYVIIGCDEDGNNKNNKAITEQIFMEVVLNRVENCKLFSPYNLKTSFDKMLYKIVFSWKLNKIVNMPFKNQFHILHKLNESNNLSVIIFVPGIRIYKQLNDKILIETRRKWPKSKLVLYLVDSIERKVPTYFEWSKIRHYFKYFDTVMTFDKHDALAYNIIYAPMPYFKYEVYTTEVTSDIYYIGADAGRAKFISDITDKLKYKNVKANITLVNNLSDMKNDGINYLYSQKPYIDIIIDIQKTNCILEVLCDGATSNTLRYNEAVVYNKKLLTNNPNIYEMKYYDARYMKYFKNIDDIDIEWVKRREKVDYGYKDDFSVKNFLNLIDKNI